MATVIRLSIVATLLLGFAPKAHSLDERTDETVNLDAKDGTGTNGGAQKAGDRFRRTAYQVDTRLNADISLSSHVRIQPPSSALDGAATDDRGIYLDQMYATYEKPQGGLRIGKYDNPAFGVAREPGIFGWESPLDEYRLNRALGVNPFAKLDGGMAGQARLDASLFRPEDAASSGPIGATTQEPSAGGGVMQLPSLALSFDANNALHVKGLGYHVGMQRLTGDPATAEGAREGVAAGLRYGASLDGNKYSTSAEIGYVRQQDGAGNDVLRPGMALQGAINDTWRAFANYSATQPAAPAETWDAPATERSYGAGLGYVFDQGPSLDLAWTRKLTEHETLAEEAARDSVGLRMRYDLKF